MEIIIKRYSEDYQQEILDLILGIQQNEFKIAITKENQPDLSDIVNYYQSNNGNFWVAIHENKVVGTIALLDIGKNQGALRKLFVRKEYRGGKYNIARLLLFELLGWAQDKEFTEIYLGTTDKFLAAHRFYEKHGFISLEKTGLPSSFPIMKVDSIFYFVKLNNNSFL